MMEAVVGNGFNLIVIVDAVSEVAPSAIHWGDCGPSTTQLHNLHQSLNFGIVSIPHRFDSHDSNVFLARPMFFKRDVQYRIGASGATSY